MTTTKRVLPMNIDHIERTKLAPQKERRKGGVIVGFESSCTDAETGGELFVEGIASVMIKNTLPPGLWGMMIADAAAFGRVERAAWCAVADGCNIGRLSREAAEIAAKTSSSFVRGAFQDGSINDTRDLARVLVESIIEAHDAIIGGRVGEEVFEVATTTLSVCSAAKIDRSSKWIVACCSVGDCKSFILRNGTTKIEELAPDVIPVARHDPGGRIGPYLESGQPDFRNLRIRTTEVEEGDIVIVASDGVTDNFDARQLGMTPKEVAQECGLVTESDSFQEPPTPEEMSLLSRFSLSGMQSRLAGADHRDPASICGSLVAHAFEVTAKIRKFAAENPTKKLPQSMREFPGFMDHTTCACFVIKEVGSALSSSTRSNFPPGSTVSLETELI